MKKVIKAEGVRVMADTKLEQLQNQEPIVFQINKIIQIGRAHV